MPMARRENLIHLVGLSLTSTATRVRPTPQAMYAYPYTNGLAATSNAQGALLSFSSSQISGPKRIAAKFEHTSNSPGSAALAGKIAPGFPNSMAMMYGSSTGVVRPLPQSVCDTGTSTTTGSLGGAMTAYPAAPTDTSAWDASSTGTKVHCPTPVKPRPGVPLSLNLGAGATPRKGPTTDPSSLEAPSANDVVSHQNVPRAPYTQVASPGGSVTSAHSASSSNPTAAIAGELSQVSSHLTHNTMLHGTGTHAGFSWGHSILQDMDHSGALPPLPLTELPRTGIAASSTAIRKQRLHSLSQLPLSGLMMMPGYSAPMAVPMLSHMPLPTMSLPQYPLTAQPALSPHATSSMGALGALVDATGINKIYGCNICGRTFKKKGGLTRHARTHTGEKPYLCPTCGKSFSQKGHLTVHQRLHTGEAPFQCSHCGKRFKTRSDMNRHERIHTGEKPFACSLCARRFTRKTGLKKHICATNA